jgi:hypothetical protein
MSRLQLLSYLTLITLIIGWFLLPANSLAVDLSNFTLNAEIQNPWLQSLPFAAVSDPNVATAGVDIDAVWTKAVCKGQKLFQAMTVNEDAAARFITPMPSPFDGDMVKEFREWGYMESDVGDKDDECDFDRWHRLKNAFRALSIDTRSAGEHGPNECFQVDHRDADIVHLDKDGKVPEIQMYTGPDGKDYRVSPISESFDCADIPFLFRKPMRGQRSESIPRTAFSISVRTAPTRTSRPY